MFKVEKVTDAKGQIYIQDPPIARFLFQGTIASWLWLVVRIYVGYGFLEAGWHKFTDPAWMNGTGQGILGFWTRAVAIPGGLLMNLAFMLAGTTSTNPVLAMLGVLLILAWKNAGYIGLDRYLLPLLKTPWKQVKPAPAPAPRKAVPARG